MHFELLEESEQFPVQPGDLIGVQWMTGQAIPFKVVECGPEQRRTRSKRHRRNAGIGTPKFFKDRRQCRRFPVKLYIREVS